MLLLVISCRRSWNFAWHLLCQLLAISQTIHTVCCEDDYFPKGKCKLFQSRLFYSVYLVFPKILFPVADLFTVRYLWVVCNEDKWCVLTQRVADVRVAWLLYLASLRSHVLRAYCNFESKQANSITLFGRRPNNFEKFQQANATAIRICCKCCKLTIFIYTTDVKWCHFFIENDTGTIRHLRS